MSRWATKFMALLYRKKQMMPILQILTSVQQDSTTATCMLCALTYPEDMNVTAGRVTSEMEPYA